MCMVPPLQTLLTPTHVIHMIFTTSQSCRTQPSVWNGTSMIPRLLTLNLGSSKLSSASTGEHAERSASRSRCLKSRNIVFLLVLCYTVFLVCDWCEHRDVLGFMLSVFPVCVWRTSAYEHSLFALLFVVALCELYLFWVFTLFWYFVVFKN